MEKESAMHIALMSMFRNMAGAPINRYFRQVANLSDHLKEWDHTLHLKLGVGDCVDETELQLARYGEALHRTGDIGQIDIIERSHGGPVYGSTEEPERLKALSFVVNGVLNFISPDIDQVIYVESDLIWEPMMWLRLLSKLKSGTDVVAPLIFAGQAFYDTWGFRDLSGGRYGPFLPYNGDLKHNGELTEVSSVGSAFVMRGDVARTCRIRDDYSLVGLHRDVRAKGFHVWVDAKEKVVHP
jgi:hypothetical protein